MRRFVKALPILAALSCATLPALGDEALLAQLGDMGITITPELQALVESGLDGESVDSLGPLIDALDGHIEAIGAVTGAAIKANPDRASQIVSLATLRSPSAAGVITKAAINAVSSSGAAADAVIVAIVTAAVKAAPAQAESVRIAATTAAPASQAAIDAVIDAALPQDSDQEESSEPPSPA